MPSEEQDVFETSERMVFNVRSESQPTKFYRVDLLANFGGGQCACKDFQIRRQSALNEGKESWTEETACKHTWKAFIHSYKLVLERMSHEENTAPKKNTPPPREDPY